MIQGNFDSYLTYARLSFLIDLAKGNYEEDPEIKKFEDLPIDEQKIYIDEAKDASNEYVITFEEMQLLEQLITKE